MNLQLNFDTFFSIGNPSNGVVNGLYVYTPQADVLSLSWNNSTTILTPTWNNVLNRYEFGGTGITNDGRFILTQNGITKSYGYTTRDSGTSYGNASSILECGDGNFWFTDDLDVTTLNQAASTQSILSWTPDVGLFAGVELFPFAVLDGTLTKGIQQAYNFGTGFTAGTTYNALVNTYAYSAILPPTVQTGTYGTFPESVPTSAVCPTCLAGDDFPHISSGYLNTCPSATFDLSTIIASNLLTGSVLEFHTSATPTFLTKITNPIVSVTSTIYAVFYNSFNSGCYSSTFSFQVTILPCTASASVTTTNINCSTVFISGTTSLAPNTAIANLLWGTTLLGSSAITVVGINGSFTINGLNLSTLGGASLSLEIVDGATVLSQIILTVGNAWCIVDEILPSPTVSIFDGCKKNCSYQHKVTGTSDMPDGSIVIIYKTPYLHGDEILGAGIIKAGAWTVNTDTVFLGKYEAIGIRLDNIDLGTVTVNTIQDCTKECVLIGTLNGIALLVNTGVVVMYDELAPTVPYNVGIIKNELWHMKAAGIPAGDYTFISIKLS